MKRKREDLTLWSAANVHAFDTFSNWWNSLRVKTLAHEPQDVQVTDLLRDIKKPSVMKGKLTTMFSVGFRPTSRQKRVLNEMLKVNNYCYNWCRYLVAEKNMPPKQFELQKIVCKTNARYVDPSYRQPGDDWYFENRLSSINLTSCKNFCTMYKSVQSNQKRRSVTLKDKPTTYIRAGSFQVQKAYVRHLTDEEKLSLNCQRVRHLSILPESFARKRDPKERFIKLSRRFRNLPPLDHDMRITKRADGKFVLQIPCDPAYTRRPLPEKSESICSIDPGGRTFATVYDPSGKAFQVGTADREKHFIRHLQKKIDLAQWNLTNAIQRQQPQAKEDRISQLQKLHLKLKNFVSDVHLGFSSFLVRHYDKFVLGKISVGSIVRKDGPNHLNRRANRDLLCWRHYDFRERLQHRVRGTDRDLLVQDGSFTSMTCGGCGTKNKTLGGNETFKCSSCSYTTHRDVNGARNILLQSLNMFPFQ